MLSNQLKKMIGHVPSNAEILSAVHYLSENCDETCDLNDARLILHDWVCDKCIECPHCCHNFLPEEGFIHEDTDVEFCCEECAYEYYQPSEF